MYRFIFHMKFLISLLVSLGRGHSLYDLLVIRGASHFCIYGRHWEIWGVSGWKFRTLLPVDRRYWDRSRWVVGLKVCFGSVLIIIIIIIKRISRAPFYHTRWQHRVLYNNNNHMHTRTHARTRHTHNHCRMRGWAGLWHGVILNKLSHSGS